MVNLIAADKILEPEIKKLEREDQIAAADQICKQWKQFEILLPEKARQHIQYFAVSAVKYIRRHIPDPFTPESFVDAVFDGARYGLAIDGRLAHALPFADKAQGGAKNLVFVPDYKGMVYVAKTRELVRDVRPYVVYEGDEFQPPGESSDGDYSWSYRPAAKGRGAPIGAICVLEFMDHRRKCEWMQEEDIRKIRQSAKTDKIWNAWPDEMRKKSVIRRAFKLHQDDPVLSALMADDDASYGDDVIEIAPKTLTLPEISTAADVDEFPDAKDPHQQEFQTPVADRQERERQAAPADTGKRRRRPTCRIKGCRKGAKGPGGLCYDHSAGRQPITEPPASGVKPQPPADDPFEGVAGQQARAEHDAKAAASAPEPLGPTPGAEPEPEPTAAQTPAGSDMSPTGESVYQVYHGYAQDNECLPDGWGYDDETQLTEKEAGDRVSKLKSLLENA